MASIYCLALLSAALLTTEVTCDLNSGCPQYGCLTWGSFSLSGPVPASNGAVKWSSPLESVNVSNGAVSQRGCISNQDFVVCTTHRGYTAFDPSNGDQLWAYNSSMTSPYLPLMDIYGDVIGSDPRRMVYVSNDGKPKNPIPTKVIDPAYGLVVSNNSILLLAGTHTETAQLFTYGTDGIIDAAYELRGSWERMNGTFVVCSQPIIAGSRAYLVTKFVPNGTEPARTANWLRLFAVDLLQQLAPRIRTAWYANFEMEDEEIEDLVDGSADIPPPIVSYYNGTVYVNRAWPTAHPGTHSALNSSIYAFSDRGNFSTRQFRTDALYGDMAVWDTYTAPLTTAPKTSGSHVVWVSANSPARLTAHSTADGGVKQVIDVNSVAMLGPSVRITSKLTITRQSPDSTQDVLVMGVSVVEDETNQAYILAIGAEPASGKASLMWKVKVSEPRPADSKTSWSVDGMVVNTAQNNPKDPQTPVLGVMAAVSETGASYRKTYVKAVF